MRHRQHDTRPETRATSIHEPARDTAHLAEATPALQLQRQYGNQAVQQMLGSPAAGNGTPLIQAKLAINAPGDRYEQEADRVAAQVVNQPAAATATSITPVQRDTVAGGSQGSASSGVEQAIAGARGGGQALAPETQATMEQRIGADFSGVRVHTDARADALSRAVQARAFTSGQDIFFRQGAYQGDSAEGQRLLAHELTHVVQQGGPAAGGILIQRNFPKDTPNDEFDEMAYDADDERASYADDERASYADEESTLGADTDDEAGNELDIEAAAPEGVSEKMIDTEEGDNPGFSAHNPGAPAVVRIEPDDAAYDADDEVEPRARPRSVSAPARIASKPTADPASTGPMASTVPTSIKSASESDTSESESDTESSDTSESESDTESSDTSESESASEPGEARALQRAQPLLLWSRKQLIRVTKKLARRAKAAPNAIVETTNEFLEQGPSASPATVNQTPELLARIHLESENSSEIPILERAELGGGIMNYLGSLSETVIGFLDFIKHIQNFRAGQGSLKGTAIRLTQSVGHFFKGIGEIVNDLLSRLEVISSTVAGGAAAGLAFATCLRFVRKSFYAFRKARNLEDLKLNRPYNLLKLSANLAEAKADSEPLQFIIYARRKAFKSGIRSILTSITALVSGIGTLLGATPVGWAFQGIGISGGLGLSGWQIVNWMRRRTRAARLSSKSQAGSKVRSRKALRLFFLGGSKQKLGKKVKKHYPDTDNPLFRREAYAEMLVTFYLRELHHEDEAIAVFEALGIPKSYYDDTDHFTRERRKKLVDKIVQKTRSTA